MTEHTHDAWIIGVHDLPEETPRGFSTFMATAPENGVGHVIVRDNVHNRWSLYDSETFDEEYEFV